MNINYASLEITRLIKKAVDINEEILEELEHDIFDILEDFSYTIYVDTKQEIKEKLDMFLEGEI